MSDEQTVPIPTGCRNAMILRGDAAIPKSCPLCGLGGCKEGIADPWRPVDPPPNVPSVVQPQGLPAMPTYSLPSAPAGCICPPGANLQCQSPTCPRKPPRRLGAIATVAVR